MAWYDDFNWGGLAGGIAGGVLGAQGTPDQTTTAKPYMFDGQQEGITNFLNASKEQYQQGPQQYYPGQTVAGLDPNTIAGQNQQLGTVNQQQGLANAMTAGVQGQIAGTPQVGGFQLQDQVGFGIDPGLQSAISNPIMRQLQEKILPSADLQATQQGAFGGSRAQQIKSQAGVDATERIAEVTARANLQARGQSIGQRAGDISAQLSGRGQDINQNQLQAQNQQWGIGAAPAAMQGMMQPGQTMQNIGAQRTAYEQALLNADKASFDFGQQADLDNVDRLGQRMQMTPTGQVSTTQGTPGDWSNILGGALSGWSLGGAINTPPPTGTQPTGGSTVGTPGQWSTY